ncbi:MAG: LysR family transcriptional regulator [Methylocystaceae bacterium]|nr:LysR family transcriptional regulator [Methylocystaceae bacterium]
MDLKQLRIFLHVAETGSLSKAAQRLNVTQPALSRQIKMLEDDAGVPLFVRTGRGVILSEAGERMAPRARILAEEMERLKTDMTAFAGEISGEVRVGLPPSSGSVMAAPIVEKFHQKYPDVKLRITQLLSGAIHDNLLNGHLDIGILFEGNVSPVLRSERLWSEEMSFLIKPDDRWKGRTKIILEEALDEPFILPGPKHGLRDIIEKQAAKIDKPLKVVVEAESLMVHTELVCRGLGCTILPKTACFDHIAKGRLIALDLVKPKIERVPCLAWSKDYPLTRAAQAMADIIREEAASRFKLL